MILKTKQYEIPEEVRSVFTSTMIARKKRMSLLVKWFMKNWWRWYSEPVVLPVDKTNSITDFADGLTRALSPYNITIKKQRVWTWLSQRNLPREDNFRVLVEIAEGWQLAFAFLVLDILDSEESTLSQNNN